MVEEYCLAQPLRKCREKCYFRDNSARRFTEITERRGYTPEYRQEVWQRIQSHNADTFQEGLNEINELRRQSLWVIVEDHFSILDAPMFLAEHCPIMVEK
jgi:hypothetical protein